MPAGHAGSSHRRVSATATVEFEDGWESGNDPRAGARTRHRYIDGQALSTPAGGAVVFAYGEEVARRVQDRAVLVTGAASGIGRATVQRAVAEGARVAAIDHAADRLQATVEQAETAGGLVASACVDVADTPALVSAIRALADQIGMVDGVFANAGILPPRVSAQSIDPVEWGRVLEVNLTGSIMT